MKLFGYQITKEDQNKDKDLRSLPSDDTDGASITQSYYSQGLAFDGTSIVDNPVQLVTKYRELAAQPEIDMAIQDIVNEAFSYDDDEMPVKINLDETKNVPDATKKKILEAFDEVLDLLNFKNNSYDIFKNWYVDGRLFYMKTIDAKQPKNGIISLQYIDPRKIKKVREAKNDANDIFKEYVEYFIYDPVGLSNQASSIIKIAPDSIAYVHSGIMDKTGRIVLSNLHKTIKPFNSLRMVEDSILIYRLTRAPEKRIFNVEIGKLPKVKAEQFLAETMKRFQNKIQYDPDTGEIKNSQRFITMIEDFWFAKREGVGTTVNTLQSGDALNSIQDVDYWKSKLYESLNVPKSRYSENITIPGIGRTSEVTRDELKFSKFISRLRKRFSFLFDDILGTHLILKQIVTAEEWDEIRKNIIYDFIEDNNFTEFKKTDLWQNRIGTFSMAAPLVDSKYLSRAFVRKNILNLNEQEWDEMRKEIEEESQDPLFQPTFEQDQQIDDSPEIQQTPQEFQQPQVQSNKDF